MARRTGRYNEKNTQPELLSYDYDSQSFEDALEEIQKNALDEVYK